MPVHYSSVPVREDAGLSAAQGDERRGQGRAVQLPRLVSGIRERVATTGS